MSARKPGSQFAAVGGRYVLAKHCLVMMYQENFLLSQCIYKTFSSQDIPAKLSLVRMYGKTFSSGCPAITFSCNNVSAKHSLVRMFQQSVLLSGWTGKTFSCQGVLALHSCACHFIGGKDPVLTVTLQKGNIRIK